MKGMRVSKYHATFSPDFVVRGRVVRFSHWLIAHSARGRDFFFTKLPRSRRRMAITARWLHWMAAHALRGNLEMVLITFTPDCVWETFGGLETYRGRSGLATFFSDLKAVVPPTEITLAEVIDPNARDLVLVFGPGETRGSASGLSVGELGEVAVVLTSPNGTANRGRMYGSKAEALEAIGLSE